MPHAGSALEAAAKSPWTRSAAVDTEWVAQVRAATPDDALGVARVHVRSWQVAYRGHVPQDYLDDLRPEDRASRYTFDRSGPTTPTTLIALEEDTICGFVTTGKSRDSDLPELGELLAMYVDPQYWGQGIGRLLMTAARDRLRRAGAREALLWVLDGNERAKRFYEFDGWRQDGSRRALDIGGVAVETVRYRCALA